MFLLLISFNWFDECLMFKMTAKELAGKPCCFRYIYFVISSLSLISFRSWRKIGEPNPFVEKTYPTKASERVDFIDIFEEYRSGPSRIISKTISRRLTTSDLR